MASLTEFLVSNTNNSVNLRSVLCATCLSINRVLHPMVALCDLVPLFNDVGLAANDKICWECRALMEKFHKFRSQARRSTTTLNSLADLHNQSIFVRSLSTLKQSTKNNFDAQFSFHNMDIMKEVKIEFEENDVKSDFSLFNTYVDTGSWQPVKEEMFLVPAALHNPVENPKKQHHVRIYPSQVSESKLRLTVSPLAIPSQLPSTSTKGTPSESGSDNDNQENYVGVNHQNYGEKLSQSESNRGKKQSKGFSNNDLIAKILTEEEMLKYREVERERSWFKSAQFRCMSCIQYFASQQALDKHNMLHCEKKQGPFACSICELRFISQKAVMIHQQIHYWNYFCRYCTYNSYSQQRLLTHWQRKHDASANMHCNDCELEFRTHRHLRYHRETAHSEKPRCVECGKTFVTTTNLNRHMDIHKGTVPEKECEICHKKYRGKYGLSAHMRSHNDPRPENAYCTECNIQFKNIYLYHTHLKTSSKHVVPDTFKFECSYCGKKFYCKTYLSNHIQAVHLKLNNIKCELCSQTFNTKAQLLRHHRANHTGKVKTRNNICDICGKAFTVRKSLAEHMNTHLGKRPFKCDVCGATFAYSAALYTHVRLLHLKLKRGKKNNAATVEQS